MLKKIMRSNYLKISVVLIIAGISLSCLMYLQEKQQVILGLTYNLLKNNHYSEIVFDENFSQKVYNTYLDYIDNDHRFLLNEDIKKLSKYQKKLSNQIRDTELSFFKESYKILVERQQKARQYVEEILNMPVDLNIDETIEILREKDEYFKNEKQLKDYWRRLIKYDIVSTVYSLDDAQNNKKKQNDTLKLKTIDELKKEAIEKVRKNWIDNFDRISKLTEEDYFNLFINSILNSADTYSEYYAPKNKEDFDIHMSGELEGIGATLSQQFGEIKVVDILPGSPAWKDGQLEIGDVIFEVTQEGKDPVNVSSMRLDDAVRLIRGKKGTVVILTVKKIDGTIKHIRLVRDKIIIEETLIKTIIIEDSKGVRTALLHIPSFYIDFQKANGRSCAEDFKNELIKLRKENIDNLIVDVRNNGGGSLMEVVKIAGYFIEKGPIVQVRTRTNQINVQEDRDASILWNGNLIVLTNYYSASASEIFAAAMQDYNRAIIFGNKQTYGKGSVQEIADLDRLVYSQYKPLGAIKITTQKYYRINGNSTQLQGVRSDIVFPSIFDKIDMSEARQKNPLPFDIIGSTKFTTWNLSFNKDSVIFYSKKRIAEDSLAILSEIYANSLADEYNEKRIPLKYENYKKYITQRLEIKKRYDAYVNSHTDKSFKFLFLKDDLALFQKDTLAQKPYDTWISKLKNDIQLTEAIKISDDIIKFKN